MSDVNAELQAAIITQDTDEIHELLNRGADINGRDNKGYTYLQMAINKGKNDAVAVLLERGADPELTAQENSYTALHVAAKCANEAAMKLLIQCRLGLEPRDNAGETPLHVAAAAGALAIAKLLVEAEAEVMPLDNNRETPRDIAARIASETTTTGQEPHFDTARFLQGIEDERGISREAEQARREKVDSDIAVLKSHHPERFKIAPKLKV
jgi:ankyrin repeat protein